MTIRSVEKKAVVVPPPPKPPPPAKPAPVRTADEMSQGQGRALRASAEAKLAAGPFSAKVGAPAPIQSFRVGFAGSLQPTAHVTATSGTQASDAKRAQARDILDQFPIPNPSALANVLRETDDPELRRALVAEAMASDSADRWFDGEMFSDSRKGQVNEGYDDLTTIGDAVSEAYRSGDVTDAQLHDLAENLGPDETAVLVQSLALGQNASGIGGVVEALGEQAEALGYDQAAALAFTSTDALIDAHYPTDEAQRAAFEHVNDFIEEYDQDSDFFEINPELRNAVGSAVVNAARLTARGNGWTRVQVDDELKELGPTLSGEIIAQAGERIFNGAANGPLDVLGDSASRLASSTDGDDRTAWQTNAAIAYTQSDALVEANLDTPEKRQAAFDTLNTYLADSRGEWSLASDDGYSLVRAPQAVEGVERLLSTHPEMITSMLDSPQGEASLVQLYESISLIPEVPQQLRDNLQGTLETYVKDQLASVEPGHADEVGERIGKLYGTLQVAANRAVEHAEADDDRVKELALGVAAGIAGVAAEAALEATTGPLGAAVGGVVVEEVLGSLFHEDPPSRDEIEGAFFDKLREAGINVSAGERGHDQISDLYLALHDSIVEQLAKGNLSDDERQALETQRDVVQGMLNGLGKFGDTLDSGEGAGELAVILNDRDDDP